MSDDYLELLRTQAAITVEEYALIRRCSRMLIYKAIKRGDIQVSRLGTHIAIPTAPLRKEFGIEE
jgi:hypothetical protein